MIYKLLFFLSEMPLYMMSHGRNDVFHTFLGNHSILLLLFIIFRNHKIIKQIIFLFITFHTHSSDYTTTWFKGYDVQQPSIDFDSQRNNQFYETKYKQENKIAWIFYLEKSNKWCFKPIEHYCNNKRINLFNTTHIYIQIIILILFYIIISLM